MKTRTTCNGFNANCEVARVNITGKTTKKLRFGISATALCYLAMVIGGAVVPSAAETISPTGNIVGGAGTGTVGVTTTTIGLDWNGLPQNNPNQVLVTSNSTGSGYVYAYLGFAVNPSTEYGVTWNMTNNSGQDWYGMHFTVLFSPQGDLSMTFDATGTYPSQPNGSPYLLPYNWTDTNIDFSGGAISGSGGTANFELPLDLDGHYHSGTFSIFATPDYAPSVPEPSSLAMFGSGVLGLGGLLRRRFLG